MANPDAHLVPDCKVSVGGKKLEGEQDARLTKVEVDLDVDLFGQCALVFNDPKLALINGPDFKAGAQVKVEIGHGSKLGKVFEGEVVALEPQFRRDLPPSLRVVCQESIHRLALKTATRALMEVDSKEIASKIAQEHGLTAQAPSGTKEHVLQANVSDSTLLRRVAATAGNHLRIEGKKLVIGPPPKGEEITVAPGNGLKKMRVRIKAAGQIGEVSVHGWDPKAKKEIVGKAKGEGVTGEGSKKHGGGATIAFADHELLPADVATAEAMAKGRMRKLAEAFVTAQVEMIGNPDVQPGAVITFDKMGEKLDGKYRVEKAHHDFGKHGYFVKFDAVWVGKKKAPGAQPAPPAEKPPPKSAEDALSWIALEVVDDQGKPIPDLRYEMIAPGGRRITGKLGQDGKARIEAVKKGSCKVQFPELPDDSWKPA
ncbi:MAG TPA: contractile injection system protein, VgrG/Pvc8 family [Myxococcales bacterium]|nr:contractile injection system protein, VgrG/Pvc8 family [Myxococcales bacterium]